MTFLEALAILEIDENASLKEAREQFRWLVAFYHPDNKETGDANVFKTVIAAYNIVKSLL